MTRLELAAIRLHQVFWNNTGSTEDWPITLRIDKDMHADVVRALNELSDAVEEICPGSSPWPVGQTL